MPSRLSSALLLLVASAATTHAASSEWIASAGGRVRLVTAGMPDASGTLRGVLEVDLLPGWKTYWRDPGGAGVPPTLQVAEDSAGETATLGFPAPEWHSDEGLDWAGYAAPVAFPVTFTLPAGAAPTIAADVFLGVCETICVPVQGRLSVAPGVDGAGDAAAVESAFASLPAAADASFGVARASFDGGTLTVEAVLPGDPQKAELFLAGENGYTFARPELVVEGNAVRFRVSASRPDSASAGPPVAYTLKGETGAVSGAIPGF